MFKIILTLAAAFLFHVVKQTLPSTRKEPPLVFHLIPWLGSTIEYGIDPEAFFRRCRQKYGDIFTFVLLGKKTTVCLGTTGNDFILNAKHTDVNAEEVYRGLTEPVFGSGVCYAVDHAKMLEQKKFLKFGLTTERLRAYVPLFMEQIDTYIENSPLARASRGIISISSIMAEMTIHTASRTLQGKEARQQFEGPEFAELYHDLDMGFAPINFVAPSLPIPANQRRDVAQRRIAGIFKGIIQRRRGNSTLAAADTSLLNETSSDMIHNLMHSRYKDGTPPSDTEIAHMLVALLMAGQHSSSSIGAWIMLRLAARPDIQEALLAEQQRLPWSGHGCFPPEKTQKDFTYDNIMQDMPLHLGVVRETLRLHAPIHSIMRAVKKPLSIGRYTIPTSHILLAAPGVTAQSEEHFPDPTVWEPGRWLTTNAAAPQLAEMTKGANSPYLPFGAGRHRCIGEAFAYLQLTTIVALLVRDFRWSYEVGSGLPKTDYSSLFSRPQDPSQLVWERRHALV